MAADYSNNSYHLFSRRHADVLLQSRAPRLRLHVKRINITEWNSELDFRWITNVFLRAIRKTIKNNISFKKKVYL
jgi:hypothetical protein